MPEEKGVCDGQNRRRGLSGTDFQLKNKLSLGDVIHNIRNIVNNIIIIFYGDKRLLDLSWLSSHKVLKCLIIAMYLELT